MIQSEYLAKINLGEIVGPEDHQHAMQLITVKGLIRPTSTQIISVLDEAFQNKDDTLCTYIINILKNHYLWTATEHITKPREGIFVYDNINGEDLNIYQLTQKLDSKNKQVRFVPYGFKTKNQSIKEFFNNQLVIKHFGEEAMPSVEKVANHLKFDPYVSALLESEKPERRYCAILLDKTTRGLALHGAGQGTGKDGYAFAIKK